MRSLAAIEHEFILISRRAHRDRIAEWVAVNRVNDELDNNDAELWARYKPEAVNRIRAIAEIVTSHVLQLNRAQLPLESVRLRTEGPIFPLSHSRAQTSEPLPPRPNAGLEGPSDVPHGHEAAPAAGRDDNQPPRARTHT